MRTACGRRAVLTAIMQRFDGYARDTPPLA